LEVFLISWIDGGEWLASPPRRLNPDTNYIGGCVDPGTYLRAPVYTSVFQRVSRVPLVKLDSSEVRVLENKNFH
jgi:hypothetical protein